VLTVGRQSEVQGVLAWALQVFLRKVARFKYSGAVSYRLQPATVPKQCPPLATLNFLAKQ
jgi:hypothetical protein